MTRGKVAGGVGAVGRGWRWGGSVGGGGVAVEEDDCFGRDGGLAAGRDIGYLLGPYERKNNEND